MDTPIIFFDNIVNICNSSDLVSIGITHNISSLGKSTKTLAVMYVKLLFSRILKRQLETPYDNSTSVYILVKEK